MALVPGRLVVLGPVAGWGDGGGEEEEEEEEDDDDDDDDDDDGEHDDAGLICSAFPWRSSQDAWSCWGPVGGWGDGGEDEEEEEEEEEEEDDDDDHYYHHALTCRAATSIADVAGRVVNTGDSREAPMAVLARCTFSDCSSRCDCTSRSRVRSSSCQAYASVQTGA
jgi:hypothetical protein